MNFNRTIQDIRDGQLLSLLSDKLAEVVEAVATHGKAGALTLTLKVKPNGEGAVTISSDVKAKSPEPAVGDAIFFVDDNGNLLRRNPRQADIEDEIAKQRAKTEAKAEVVA